jgi:putative hydrolase of the HAD superfamily
MIRNIIFDLGQVLVPFDRGIGSNRLRPHLPGKSALLLTEDPEAFFALFEEPAIELETGRIDFDRFASIMQRILGTRVDRDEFRLIWCDIFRPDEGMVELGERLSARYDTYLASNTSRVHYEWIIGRFPRVVFYRDAALSYELGVMKPDLAYFEKAVEQFGIDPAESVFIDDREENVAAAADAGLHALTFRNRERLVKELMRLGVVVDAPPRGDR